MDAFLGIVHDQHRPPARTAAELAEMLRRWEGEFGTPSDFVRRHVSLNLELTLAGWAGRRIAYNGWSRDLPADLPGIQHEYSRATSYCRHYGFPHALDLNHVPTAAERLIGRVALGIVEAEATAWMAARQVFEGKEDFFGQVGERPPLEPDRPPRRDDDEDPQVVFYRANREAVLLRRVAEDSAADLVPELHQQAMDAADEWWREVNLLAGRDPEHRPW